MKFIITIALVILTCILLVGCKPELANKESELNLRVYPHDHKDIKQAVEMIRDNMSFFRVGKKCFGCAFISTTRPTPVIIEISCEDVGQ
jgi:hypothetical protein